MNSNKIWAGIFAGAALTVLSACLMPVGDGDGLNANGDVPPNVESLESIVPLFALSATNCTGCHGSSAGLNLSDFDNAFNSFFQIVGGDTVPRNATTTAGAGLKRVLPGNADSSHLVQRITATNSTKMPLGNPNRLDDETVTRIRKWINDGALIRDTTTRG